MTEKGLSFPKSWYPLCRSSDVKHGKVIRQIAFGVPLAIYRTGQGRVAALNATCIHMGADLSRGRVVGERLQCPLHEWEFGANGRCEHIPATAEIPERANFHYDYCRKLGQLAAVQIVNVTRGAERYLHACQARGQKLGNIKPSLLQKTTGWKEWFEGEKESVL